MNAGPSQKFSYVSTTSTPLGDSTYRTRSAITVAGISLGLAAGFAPVYFATIGVFLKPISEEFGWGRGQASLGGVISMLGLALGSLAVGRVIDRYGATRTIVVSIILMSVGIAAQSRIGGSFGIYMFLSFLIGIAGTATNPPGYLTVLARSFEGRLGLALGVAGSGLGVGIIITPMAAQSLISQFGWRGAYLALALAALVLGLLACTVISRLGLRPGAHSESSVLATEDASASAVDDSVLRQPLVWRIGLMVLLVSVATIGISIHLVSILLDSGWSAASAASAASFSGFGVLLGRLVSGVLIDRFPANKVAAVFFLTAAAGAGVLATQLSSAAVVFFAAGALIGFSMGAEGDFLPFFVRRYLGLKNFGTLFGGFFFLHSIGGVLGPYLVGLGFDSWNSYVPALWIAAGALCVAAALAASLGPYRHAAAVAGAPH